MSEFNNSIEATEFLAKLESMLNDPRLAQWCQVSDYHFGVTAERALQQAQARLAEMVKQLDDAC